ncbi:MAG TPA: tRNA lysidine(34) synthetase TilS [Acetobacteraceae bacterium]|jgi:tRNA(Ile)-lysidine synthase
MTGLASAAAEIPPAGSGVAAGIAPIAAVEFAALMAPLGPFGPTPRLAAGVSGGADSLALALLADAWARAQGGSLMALVVDHGLRAESAVEAVQTIERLTSRGIPARLLTLPGLHRGPALAERARTARYDTLGAACAEAGILHLLLGHHAADQAETVLMRRRSHSGPAGLAAMPAISERHGQRLVRPLLGIPPVRLRATLRAAGLAWVEDPSNADLRALRPRLRASLADPDGTGPEIAALCDDARRAGFARAAQETETADILAERASIHPEGYALLSPGPSLPPAVLSALLQAVSGAVFPPPSQAVAALAAAVRPATLGGVRLMFAPRLGAGLLLVREQAAIGPPVPARRGAVWDERFRLAGDAIPSDRTTIGALGADAARLRRHSPLPAAVIRTLPALRRGNSLVAVPLLEYPSAELCAGVRTIFAPRRPAAGAPFVPG